MLGTFWDLRNHSNVQVVWYEDILKDMAGTIINMSSFLGYRLTKEQEGKVEQFVTFSEYKQNCQLGNKAQWNEGEGHFIRKGKVGDWKNYMEGDMNMLWDNWIREEVDKIRIKNVYPI